MRRYEQSSRIVATFFAALLGFGLKRLLDAGASPPDPLSYAAQFAFPAELAAPCFVLSVLLFLRFLIGSANHFWFQYIATDWFPPARAGAEQPAYVSVPKPAGWVLLDLLIPMVLGVLGAFSCYARTLEGFFAGHFAIVLIALVWSGVYFYRKRAHASKGWTSVAFVWLLGNAVQLSFIAVIGLGRPTQPPCELPIATWGWFPYPAWDFYLAWLILCYFVVLCIDVYFGLLQLGRARPS